MSRRVAFLTTVLVAGATIVACTSSDDDPSSAALPPDEELIRVAESVEPVDASRWEDLLAELNG